MIKYDSVMTIYKKLFKPEYMVISQNNVVGLNKFKSVISDVDIDSLNFFVSDGYKELSFPIVICMKEFKWLSNMIMGFKVENEDENEDDDESLLSKKHPDNMDETQFGIRLNPHIIFDGYSGYHEVMQRFYYMTGMEREDKKVISESIKNHPTIIDMINGKSKDGKFPLIYDRKYYMIIYKTMFPINKTDDFLISIYDDPTNEMFFNVKFTIVKKKDSMNLNYHMMFYRV